MQMNNLNLPVPMDDGSWVNEKVARIAELISEYDHNLEVRWIPRNRRAEHEPAFAIVEHTPRNGGQSVVFYVNSEEEFDERVLQRIYEQDSAKHGNILDKVESHNRAVRALRQKEADEAAQDKMDLLRSIALSPKHTYRHNGVVYD